jgi:hypothetical protein
MRQAVLAPVQEHVEEVRTLRAQANAMCNSLDDCRRCLERAEAADAATPHADAAAALAALATVQRTAVAAPALLELHVRALLVQGDFAGCLKLLPPAAAPFPAAAAAPPLWADWAVARAAYGQGEAERAQVLLQALVGRALAEEPGMQLSPLCCRQLLFICANYNIRLSIRSVPMQLEAEIAEQRARERAWGRGRGLAVGEDVTSSTRSGGSDGEAAAAAVTRTAAAARALLSTVTQQLAHKTAGNTAFKNGQFSQVGCV